LIPSDAEDGAQTVVIDLPLEPGKPPEQIIVKADRPALGS